MSSAKNVKAELIVLLQTERGGIEFGAKIAEAVATYLVDVAQVEDVKEVMADLKPLKTYAEEAWSHVFDATMPAPIGKKFDAGEISFRLGAGEAALHPF